MHFVGFVLLMVAAIDASSDTTIYWVGVPEPTTEGLSKNNWLTTSTTTTTSQPILRNKPEPFKFVPRQNVAFSGNEGRGVAYWFPTSSSLRASGSIFTTPTPTTSTLTPSTTTTDFLEMPTKKSIITTPRKEEINNNIISTSPTPIITPLNSDDELKPEHRYYPVWRLNVVNGTDNTPNVALNVTAADVRLHNQNITSRNTNIQDAFIKLLEHDPKGAVDSIWSVIKTFYVCIREHWSSGNLMSCIAKRTMRIFDLFLYPGYRHQSDGGLFDEPRRLASFPRPELDEEEDNDEENEDDQDDAIIDDESNEVDYNDNDDTFKFTSTDLQRGSRRKEDRRKRKEKRRDQLKYFGITKHLAPIFYSIGLTILTLKMFSLFLMAATSGKALIVSVVALTMAIANVMKKTSLDATRRTDMTSSTGSAITNYDNNIYPNPMFNAHRIGFLNDTDDALEKKNKYFM